MKKTMKKTIKNFLTNCIKILVKAGIIIIVSSAMWEGGEGYDLWQVKFKCLIHGIQ